jgi:hypothetical protein
MSTEVTLNNSVVIPAKEMREYPKTTLTKNNIVGQVSITNPNYLVSRTEKDAYVFASIDSVSGSTDSEWKKGNDSVLELSFGSKSPSDETTEVLLASSTQTQGKSTIRVSGTLEMSFEDYNTRSYTENIDKYYLSDGETKTFSHKFQYSSGATTIIYVFLRYSLGNLYAKAKIERNLLYGFKSWSSKIKINAIDFLVVEGSSSTITGIGGKSFVVGSSVASLSDNS